MKVYVRAPYSEERLAELREMFDEVVYEPWTVTGERYYEDEMLENLLRVKPDALITELDKITEKVLNGYEGLQFIGDCRATPANIDVDACTAHNIPLLCTPGRNTQAVAEMVLGLILTFLRNTLPAVQWARDGKWVPGTTPYYLWMGNELQGKKVGLVGFGAISHALVKLLDAFDCEILFYDPFVPESQGKYKKAELAEVFAESDIISLHLPVTQETTGMITEELLRTMKPSAVFVNAARSAVVDYPGLRKVLEDGVFRGAVLDVLDVEPPTDENDLALIQLPNVLVTPHICGSTYEVTNHQADIMNNRIKKLWAKENLERVVYNRAILNK